MARATLAGRFRISAREASRAAAPVALGSLKPASSPSSSTAPPKMLQIVASPLRRDTQHLALHRGSHWKLSASRRHT